MSGDGAASNSQSAQVAELYDDLKQRLEMFKMNVPRSAASVDFTAVHKQMFILQVGSQRCPSRPIACMNRVSVSQLGRSPSAPGGHRRRLLPQLLRPGAAGRQAGLQRPQRQRPPDHSDRTCRSSHQCSVLWSRPLVRLCLLQVRNLPPYSFLYCKQLQSLFRLCGQVKSISIDSTRYEGLHPLSVSSLSYLTLCMCVCCQGLCGVPGVFPRPGRADRGLPGPAAEEREAHGAVHLPHRADRVLRRLQRRLPPEIRPVQ